MIPSLVAWASALQKMEHIVKRNALRKHYVLLAKLQTSLAAEGVVRSKSLHEQDLACNSAFA